MRYLTCDNLKSKRYENKIKSLVLVAVHQRTLFSGKDKVYFSVQGRMKILYAVQGTGNGHLSRAADVVPCLAKHANVDVLVSGIQSELSLALPVKYKLQGLSFIFGKTGGVDLWKTVSRANPKKLIKAISSLPIDDYDLVINDFEPVSAWACYLRNKPCIALSHQAAVMATKSPKPGYNDRIGKLILHHYAPASARYGFHFDTYDQHIYTPVIRKQVREQQITDEGHYTVYLPAYDDERLIKKLSVYTDVRWEVFSKHNKKPVKLKNMNIWPIDAEKFIRSMASASGVLCGAGFETPAEALYMGKKLLVIPMKNQYEQHLNAAALAQMGVPVIKSLKAKHRDLIRDWLADGKKIKVDYPDNLQAIVDTIVTKHVHDTAFGWSLDNQFQPA